MPSGRFSPALQSTTEQLSPARPRTRSSRNRRFANLWMRSEGYADRVMGDSASHSLATTGDVPKTRL